ncbi:MAG: efflux RND transporter periplasmic adaptor subunit [Halioglobus sp.]
MLVRTVISALFVLSLLSACAKPEPEPRPVRKLRTIEVGNISNIRNGQLPGRARSAQEVDLAFDVSGTLIERPVSIGSQVEEGDLIARLDPRDFQANLRAAEADARIAKRNFDRGAELVETNFISEAEFDRLEARVDISQASLDLAQKALTDSEIYAPFSGVIATLSVENFQSVRAKAPIARLLGVDMIEMVVNVSENQMANLPFIDNIEVEFDAFSGVRLPATITEISSEASQTTRTFPITLSMKQPEDRKVLAGMAGTAFITGTANEEEGRGYVIPAGALFGEPVGNTSKVWVVQQDNTVSSRQVSVGRVTAGGVQVLEGLQAGDLIATAGIHTLSEGQEVIVARNGE